MYVSAKFINKKILKNYYTVTYLLHSFNSQVGSGSEQQTVSF